MIFLSLQVDLSYREAESTLLVWEMQLKRLQKESSVRVIAYELNLAQTTPSVRISAHKNGDTNYNEGIIVIGNSINQVMELKESCFVLLMFICHGLLRLS